MGAKREKLYLIDGSSYIFRAYYAIRPLSNSKGLPTNALYGFARMLLKLIKDEKPDKVAIVFDTVEPTFRDEMYEDYKANRKEPPDDLVPQFPYFEPIVDALNIRQFAKPGFEADDLIGTLAKKAEAEGYDVVVITGDKDFMQLVDDHITLYDTMKERVVKEDEVKKKFGVGPAHVADIMGLIGDSSDNIPGVRGVGFKSAQSLIKQFGSLENLLGSIDKISNIKIRNALKEHAEDAKLSKKLATIKTDVPLKYKWSEFEVGSPDSEKVKKLFSELEFFSLLRELLPAEGAEDKGKDCEIIRSGEDLEKLAGKAASKKSVSLYFIGESGRKTFPFTGIGVSFAKGAGFYIPVAHETLEEAPNIDIEKLKNFFGGLKGIKKNIYDAKPVLRKIDGEAFALKDLIDVRLMSYVLNPSYPADLITLAQQVLGIHLPHDDSGKKKKGQNTSLTVAEAANNVGLLADLTGQLAEKLAKELAKNRALEKMFTDVELPLMDVLVKMEEKGILVDIKQLNDLSVEYDKKIKKLEAEIFKEAGEEFVISSPKQLAHILFEKLNLPVIKKTKTGYSTDAQVLEELSKEYDLPKKIVDYRSLTKLKSTYIDVLPNLAAADERIHTTFNQAVTATGRLSSSDPNLQNVPARSEEGLRIRKAFIADKGFQLLSADYSQIELRILAHISEEKELLKAFENGEDVHSTTAAKLFGVKNGDVDAKMRNLAKTVNFGVLYGQGAYGLSQQLDISVEEADSYIKNYYESYPAVKKLKDEILKEAEKNGYVETIFGRRRYVPDINSTNKGVKAFAERTAFNAVFQGTAADIIKMAMLEIDKILTKDFPDTFMLLQVHDELVFEVPDKKTAELSDVVRDAMCKVTKLKVPLEVDIGIGKNWAECKSVK